MGVIGDRAEKTNKCKKKKMEMTIRIKALTESGYSVNEIAKVLNVSESYVRNVLKEIKND